MPREPRRPGTIGDDDAGGGAGAGGGGGGRAGGDGDDEVGGGAGSRRRDSSSGRGDRAPFLPLVGQTPSYGGGGVYALTIQPQPIRVARTSADLAAQRSFCYTMLTGLRRAHYTARLILSNLTHPIETLTLIADIIAASTELLENYEKFTQSVGAIAGLTSGAQVLVEFQAELKNLRHGHKPGFIGWMRIGLQLVALISFIGSGIARILQAIEKEESPHVSHTPTPYPPSTPAYPPHSAPSYPRGIPPPIYSSYSSSSVPTSQSDRSGTLPHLSKLGLTAAVAYACGALTSGLAEFAGIFSGFVVRKTTDSTIKEESLRAFQEITARFNAESSKNLAVFIRTVGPNCISVWAMSQWIVNRYENNFHVSKFGKTTLTMVAASSSLYLQFAEKALSLPPSDPLFGGMLLSFAAIPLIFMVVFLVVRFAHRREKLVPMNRFLTSLESRLRLQRLNADPAQKAEIECALRILKQAAASFCWKYEGGVKPEQFISILIIYTLVMYSEKLGEYVDAIIEAYQSKYLPDTNRQETKKRMEELNQLIRERESARVAVTPAESELRKAEDRETRFESNLRDAIAEQRRLSNLWTAAVKAQDEAKALMDATLETVNQIRGEPLTAPNRHNRFKEALMAHARCDTAFKMCKKAERKAQIDLENADRKVAIAQEVREDAMNTSGDKRIFAQNALESLNKSEDQMSRTLQTLEELLGLHQQPMFLYYLARALLVINEGNEQSTKDMLKILNETRVQILSNSPQAATDFGGSGHFAVDLSPGGGGGGGMRSGVYDGFDPAYLGGGGRYLPVAHPAAAASASAAGGAASAASAASALAVSDEVFYAASAAAEAAAAAAAAGTADAADAAVAAAAASAASTVADAAAASTVADAAAAASCTARFSDGGGRGAGSPAAAADEPPALPWDDKTLKILGKLALRFFPPRRH